MSFGSVSVRGTLTYICKWSLSIQSASICTYFSLQTHLITFSTVFCISSEIHVFIFLLSILYDTEHHRLRVRILYNSYCLREIFIYTP